MPSKPRHARPPLMISVLAELGAGRVSEGRIHDKEAFTEGLCIDSKHIVIDPVPNVVDSLLHEALHRLHPEWSENYVRNRTTFLLRRLTDAEVTQIYQEYQNRKGVRKRPVVVD